MLTYDVRILLIHCPTAFPEGFIIKIEARFQFSIENVHPQSQMITHMRVSIFFVLGLACV